MEDINEFKQAALKTALHKGSTPMLKQYVELVREYKDYILFYRVGDFYELFYEMAVTVAAELNLTLTARSNVPMCGVPYHSIETYTDRLAKKGMKIAVCEQQADPQNKNLMIREVTNTITSGTLLSPSYLDENVNNYIGSIYVEKDAVGYVFADLSTSHFYVLEHTSNDVESNIIDKLTCFAPVELIYNPPFKNFKTVFDYLYSSDENVTTETVNYPFEEKDAADFFYRFHFTVNDNKSFSEEILRHPLGSAALYNLLKYVDTIQKGTKLYEIRIDFCETGSFMQLGASVQRNLELTETIRTREHKGTLCWVLDKTMTKLGKRKLLEWIERPLTSKSDIDRRLDAVGELKGNLATTQAIRDNLKLINDLERIATRLVCGQGGLPEFYVLCQTCLQIPNLKALLISFNAPLLKEIDAKIDTLDVMVTLLSNAIICEKEDNDKPSYTIREGFNEKYDRCRDILADINQKIYTIELLERERSRIKNLHITYSRNTGYCFEVSKSNLGAVPYTYELKQTLTNSSKFKTEELKKVEREFLEANANINNLEESIIDDLRTRVKTVHSDITTTAIGIANLDVLGTFAIVATENNYCRPEITNEPLISIKDGRHPVIEKALRKTPFTPNDTELDCENVKFIILTGPNMAGKSTFMRQIALITIMAQIGCYVPASAATIGIVDKIFTRIGASDDLSTGKSTFMVEMSEVAEILKNATPKSLIIMDEIGRGTSTSDGVSIAQAIVGYITENISCRTLFSTHFHELIELENRNQGIKNFSISTIKNGDELTFLHKITEGGVSESYGIEVAKLAGVPEAIIEDAKRILEKRR